MTAKGLLREPFLLGGVQMTSRWRQTTPDELADWLAPVTVPWAIAGGWALTLWSGQQGREHSDIEISCLLGHLEALLGALGDFEIAIARNKQLSPWVRGNKPEQPFSLWLRRPGDTLWAFEILAELHQGDAWHYRRAPEITRPLRDLFIPSPGGMQVIAPEVQLLYKCKEPRDKDLADLQRIVPMLDYPAREWLLASVATAHPHMLDVIASL